MNILKTNYKEIIIYKFIERFVNNRMYFSNLLLKIITTKLLKQFQMTLVGSTMLSDIIAALKCCIRFKNIYIY